MSDITVTPINPDRSTGLWIPVASGRGIGNIYVSSEGMVSLNINTTRRMTADEVELFARQLLGAHQVAKQAEAATQLAEVSQGMELYKEGPQ